MPDSLPAVLTTWHGIVTARSPEGLADLLDEAAVFRSPAVHAPQRGKALTAAYLTAAIAVLGPTLEYQRQWIDQHSAVLEFTATLDDREIHGIDMITWNDADKITDFTVMVRPYSALNTVIEHMSDALARLRS